MKTKLLFIAMMLIGLSSANATKTNVAPKGEDLLNTTRYHYIEPIIFVERGVEFLIFPDGSFDFNTNPGISFGSYNDSYNDSYYYRAPGTVSRVHYSTPRNGGILIQHDYDGKVRRIGNVFINYDDIGKVKRVGTVYMKYNRGEILSQVGGLRLTYNHWGKLVNSYGIVNTYNSQYNYGLGQGHAFGTYNDNDFDDSGDYYYYRQGDKVKKQNKIK